MRFIDRIIATCASIAIAVCGLPPMTALAAPQDELARARRELDTYGQQLAEVQTQLVKGADELNVTESQIVEAQNEADQTKKELSEAQAVLAEHIRENYRAGSSTLISVLLEAETVEDLVCRVYYLDKIAERNSNEIAQVRELQTSLDQQVTDLVAQRDEQQRMLDEAAEQAQVYTERIEEAQAYYNELNAKVQAQLEAEAAAAAAKAQASVATRPINNYGVITDGVQNAMEAITSNVPVAPVVEEESSDDESAQSEATEETSETSEEETNESNDNEETSTEEETTDDEQEATEEPADEEAAEESTGDESTDEETSDAETDEEASASQDEETPAEDVSDEQSETTEDESAQTESEEQTEEEAVEEETEEEPAEEPEQQAEEEPADEPQPAAAAGNDGARSAIISMAYQYLGVPYVWGGKSPSGFDCSGLTTFCYENCGVDVGGNRTTYQLISWIQERGNWKTSMDELQPGDMLFPSAGHVAIYLGGGRMIHAPHEGDVVREADVYAFYGGGWAG